MKRRITYRVLGSRMTAVALAAALGALSPLAVGAHAVYAAPTAPGAVGTSAVVSEPAIVSEGAVVIDAATGNILYGKNPHEKLYPASITKLMTALLVLEHCRLDETVKFSKTATTNLEAGAVALNLVEGDKLTVEQCLYALLLKSANEVGNALAEHVSGSVSAFADLMNQKAASLGCTGTHFTNPHGLNDVNHYTTPYDMALIARAAFENATLRKIDTTLSYQIPATIQNSARTITMGHKMMYPTDSRYYPGIIGGKTGYTSKAGNTLVTGVEQDGIRLIAVVMKSSSAHYTDTKALLDYGFAKMKGNVGPDVNEITMIEPGGDQLGGDVVSPISPIAPGTSEFVGNADSAGNTDSQTAGWVQDGERWYYIKADGTRAAGEWLSLEGESYWIDMDGYMATGWRQFDNGDWYYFRGNGAMAKNRWMEDLGKWFYLGENGALLKNTVTPDGCVLDADGVWIP